MSKGTSSQDGGLGADQPAASDTAGLSGSQPTQPPGPEMPARTPAERFGGRVAAKRAERDLSMRGLCAAAGIPSASTINRIEVGASVSLETAARVARALGLSLDGLLDPCTQCGDVPPAGFTCNACGAEAARRNAELRQERAS